MLVYSVSWFQKSDLSKGKGRGKDKETSITFSVLCRSISDASFCLEYIFKNVYVGRFSIDDGEAKFTRKTLDSRSFEIDYLYMDGVHAPIRLSDLKKSMLTYFPKIY